MQSSSSHPPDDVPEETLGDLPEESHEDVPMSQPDPAVEAEEAALEVLPGEESGTDPQERATLESALKRWGMPDLAPAVMAGKQVPQAQPPGLGPKPVPDHLASVNRWLGLLGPAALLVFAFFYYQQYYISGLNLSGEGGTNAVIAMRLIEGQRPIADTFLGYNVMWFYPLVWLFQIVGPDFNAMRIFFYSLSAITAVVAFATVRRVTGQAWLALGCGVLATLLPGMLFRNYLPLMPALNVFVLLSAFVFEAATPGRRFLWYVAAGLTLGWTLLTRIDVGLFFAPIYVGAILLWPLAVRGRFWSRIPEAVAGFLTVVVVAGLLHVPFLLDARTRGFEENFVGQYRGIWGLIQYEAKRQIFDKVIPSTSEQRGSDVEGATLFHVSDVGIGAGSLANESDSPDDGSEGGGTRPRPPLEALTGDASLNEKSFVFAIYLPVVISGVILAVSSIGLFVGIFWAREDLKRDALAAGVMIGGALTLFPQYFFFRPDTPHLAEFRIPFLVAMACACFLAVKWMWPRSLLLKLGVIVFILACVAWEVAFFSFAYYKDSSGSVRARHNRTAEFVAENGVRALINTRDVDWMNGLRDAVLQHSDSSDWVVTYPYSPTINFMTNRRSYLYNLYVDNVTAPQNFSETALKNIREFRPAVVVVDDRPINNTEISRFSRWAAPTMNFLKEEYVQIGQFHSISVFARTDKVSKNVTSPEVPE